ncbi:dna primase small subunit [Ophiostoma piceae UAMH 11346]|uniref:DNA primase n=1 Tax=Ophiostoma piceae (strain UAMH 11346) TaxID=1262450 RepID=S3CRS4_OPHP1|nr:dna primase small subunit [Ophiostoma piceae UAMH 11346]
MPHAVSDPPSPAQDATMEDTATPTPAAAEAPEPETTGAPAPTEPTTDPSTATATEIETDTKTPEPSADAVKMELPSSPPGFGGDVIDVDEFGDLDDIDIDIDIEMSDSVAAAAASAPANMKMEDTSAAHTAAIVTIPAASSAAAASKEDAEIAAKIEGGAPNLEDLFDDDDDDLIQDLANTEFSTADVLSREASDPGVMRLFYQRLFPWRYLFQWLNHSPTPTNDFAHREFAFTLQNDAYLRYQSFSNSEMLRKDVLRLMPSRFEIGPVYTANPADRKLFSAAAFKPLAKELCFDIDLTDYDDIRTCCDKANICNRCWQFITMAIEVIDVALRDDFGFKHIVWVYSGRRGAHAWVCDKRARGLDDQKRKAIVGYLELLRGGSHGGKRVSLRRPLHPHILRSLNILKGHFQEDVLRDQDPWDTPERADKLLALLPDRQLQEALRKKWDAAPGRSSTLKWADIDAVAKTGSIKSLDMKGLLEAKQDIVLEYTYPRLDAGVSKKLNHLLKSPFVVHPGTGRVCVPIDVRKPEDFDPLAVPTVQRLLHEIDTYKPSDEDEADEAEETKDKEGDEEKKLQDWEKTSLRPFIELFRSFVLGLMRDEKDVKVKRERSEGMEF